MKHKLDSYDIAILAFEKPRQQLYRFGEPYASWGTKEDIIKRETDLGEKWWLMRLLGWHIKDEFKFK